MVAAPSMVRASEGLIVPDTERTGRTIVPGEILNLLNFPKTCTLGMVTAPVIKP
jgi:hypothetical protein